MDIYKEEYDSNVQTQSFNSYVASQMHWKRLKKTLLAPNQNTISSKLKSFDYDHDKNPEDSGTGCHSKYFWVNPTENSPSTIFCTESSLHGLKYLGQSNRHILERIFWSLVFGGAVVAAAYFINTVFTVYNKNPVIIAFNSEETSIQRIPFPAVTICNINNILKSKAQEYFRDAKGSSSDPKTQEARMKLNYMDHICSTTPAFSRKFNYSLSETYIDPQLVANATKMGESQGDIMNFFTEASQDCNQMIPLCLWRGRPLPCNDLFRGIESDYGFCCVFKMVPQSLLYRYRNNSWDREEDILAWKHWIIDEDDGMLIELKRNKSKINYPRRQKLLGRSSGLSVMLNPDLEEYFCTNSDSVGFQMALHLPMEAPHVADKAIAIIPNSEVFVDITPQLIMAQKQIKDFPLPKRKCYNQGEFSLHFYQFYTANNCYDECLANRTFLMCNCVLYYFARDDSRGLCNNDQYYCTEEVKRKFVDEGAENYCAFCLPSCQEIHYSSETTSLPMQNSYNVWQDKNGNAEWHNKNVSVVHIFMGVGSTYSRLRSELYTTVDLIASTGGLLGLCLGFSGISLIEIVYFLTLRAYCGMKRKRNTQANVVRQFQSNDLWTKTKAVTTKSGTQTPTWCSSNSRELVYPQDDIRYWKARKSETDEHGSKNNDHVVLDINSYF